MGARIAPHHQKVEHQGGEDQGGGHERGVEQGQHRRGHEGRTEADRALDGGADTHDECGEDEHPDGQGARVCHARTGRPGFVGRHGQRVAVRARTRSGPAEAGPDATSDVGEGQPVNRGVPVPDTAVVVGAAVVVVVTGTNAVVVSSTAQPRSPLFTATRASPELVPAVRLQFSPNWRGRAVQIERNAELDRAERIEDVGLLTGGHVARWKGPKPAGSGRREAESQ